MCLMLQAMCAGISSRTSRLLARMHDTPDNDARQHLALSRFKQANRALANPLGGLRY